MRLNDVLGVTVGLAAAVFLFLALVSIGASEHRAKGRCLASHEESDLMMIPNGSGGFLYIPTTTTVCDRREVVR